ncbi:PQQ-binding-like beta-propeller repeat protein [candidate division KSB1 bacterium]|nr:PQQ-binding-like beta-propeller repeat protein [candidate division KSB1 bacterium]
MKSKSLIGMLVSMSFVMSFSLHSQKISSLEDLGSRVEKLQEVKIPIAQSNNEKPEYSILKNGISVLSADYKSIECYSFDGQLRWQAQSVINSTNGGLQGTPNGDFFCHTIILNEDKFACAVYNAEGQLLWHATYDSPLDITPSGKYLVSNYDALDGSMPFMVFDLSTGKVIWQVEPQQKQGHGYWQAGVSLDDKLIFYNAGSLRLYDLSSGEIRWVKKLELEVKRDLVKVFISRLGNVVAANYRSGTRGNEKRSIVIYDSSGLVLWKKSESISIGKNNGGVVFGISAEGEFININNIGEFAVYDIRNQQKLFAITENAPGGIAVFSKRLIAFFPTEKGTRLLVLNHDGTLAHDYELKEYVEFKYEQPLEHVVQGKAVNHVVLYQLKFENSSFKVSKFHLKL